MKHVASYIVGITVCVIILSITFNILIPKLWGHFWGRFNRTKKLKLFQEIRLGYLRIFLVKPRNPDDQMLRNDPGAFYRLAFAEVGLTGLEHSDIDWIRQSLDTVPGCSLLVTQVGSPSRNPNHARQIAVIHISRRLEHGVTWFDEFPKLHSGEYLVGIDATQIKHFAPRAKRNQLERAAA